MSGHVSLPPIGETELERRQRAQRIGAERRASGESRGFETEIAALYRAYGGHAVASTREERS